MKVCSMHSKEDDFSKSVYTIVFISAGTAITFKKDFRHILKGGAITFYKAF